MTRIFTRFFCLVGCALFLACAAMPVGALGEEIDELLRQAVESYEDGETQKAFMLCGEAIDLDPTAIQAYELIGQIILETFDSEVAPAAVDMIMTQGFEAGAESGYMYLLRCYALYQQKRLPEALADIEKAIALEPSNEDYEDIRLSIISELADVPVAEEAVEGFPVTMQDLTVTFPEEPEDLGIREGAEGFDPGDTLRKQQLILPDGRAFSFVAIYMESMIYEVGSAEDAKMIFEWLGEGLGVPSSAYVDGGKVHELPAGSGRVFFWTEYVKDGERCRLVYDGELLNWLIAPDDAQGEVFLNSMKCK